jgi:hypothetical protein
MLVRTYMHQRRCAIIMLLVCEIYVSRGSEGVGCLCSGLERRVHLVSRYQSFGRTDSLSETLVPTTTLITVVNIGCNFCQSFLIMTLFPGRNFSFA